MAQQLSSVFQVVSSGGIPFFSALVSQGWEVLLCQRVIIKATAKMVRQLASVVFRLSFTDLRCDLKIFMFPSVVNF